MTAQETAGIMTILHIAYPRYYANTTDDDKKAALQLWSVMFADYEYDVIAAAVKAVIATSKFPPTIADVNEKLQLFTASQEMSELEAWDKVRKAICNSSYNSEEEFNKLPEECKALVHSSHQLKAWAQVSEKELNTVVASNFMRDFRSSTSRRREQAMLPDSVKEAIGNAAAKKQLTEAAKQ